MNGGFYYIITSMFIASKEEAALRIDSISEDESREGGMAPRLPQCVCCYVYDHQTAGSLNRLGPSVEVDRLNGGVLTHHQSPRRQSIEVNHGSGVK